MKKKLLLAIAVTVLSTVGWIAAHPLASPEWERENLKVLKVFSAHDGDAVFREYLVNWRDQEVVAKDPLVMTDYKVGDTIPVLVMKNRYPNGKPGPDLLSFSVVSR